MTKHRPAKRVAIYLGLLHADGTRIGRPEIRRGLAGLCVFASLYAGARVAGAPGWVAICAAGALIGFVQGALGGRPSS